MKRTRSPRSPRPDSVDFTADGQGPGTSNPSDEETSKMQFDPGPRPCVMPEETTCFAVTLTGKLPMLLLSMEDVNLLTNNTVTSSFGEEPTTLLVFDRSNNPYQMTITRRISSPESFILGKDWNKFVCNNNVVEHDSLVFNRFYISGTCFYRLEVLKLNNFSNQPWDEFEYKFTRRLPDIGRATPEYNRLRIYVKEAFVLVGNIELRRIRPLRRVLTVFDEDLFVYSIVLSDHVDGEWRGYALSHNWSNIIERNRLSKGDTIVIWKFISQDGHFYYKLKVSGRRRFLAGLERCKNVNIGNEDIEAVN